MDKRSETSSREAFEAWWDEFASAHEDWRFSDSDALRFQAWQAATEFAKTNLASRDAEPVAWINLRGDYVEVSRPDTVYGSHTIPLYKSPPLTKAAVSAAIEQCAKVCKREADDAFADYAEDWGRAAAWIMVEIRALQTEDGLAALREFGVRIAEEAYGYSQLTDVALHTIVDRVLREMGGE